MLVNYISSIETATELAESIDEEEVCVMLGKVCSCSSSSV